MRSVSVFYMFYDHYYVPTLRVYLNYPANEYKFYSILSML